MATTPALLKPLARLLGRSANVEAHEISAVVAAFSVFFCVQGGYFAVRPVRETIGTILGSEQVSHLWLFTSVGSIAIVPLYGWLVGQVRRSVLLPAIYAFVALAFVGFGMAFSANPESQTVGSVFYVWISVLNLMLVSVFWSFLLEMFSGAQTKRLFGVIATGGTLGALIGPLITDVTVQHVGTSGVLYIGSVLFVGAILCQRVLLRVWHAQGTTTAGTERAIGGNPFAGLTIVLKSPYLLMIAAFVVLLSTANTLLYFQQLDIVAATFTDRAQRTQVFARIDYVVQTLTIFSQFFLTGRIAARLGVTALLTTIPLVIMGGFLVLSTSGSFAVLATTLVIRRWGEYAFIRPGREMLFSPLTTEAKYKGKNLIDVPVYRGADALVAQLQNALKASGTTATGVALLGAGAALVWAGIGAWLGRRHESRPTTPPTVPTTP
jgi:AAA family ATP:ADP antiporter